MNELMYHAMVAGVILVVFFLFSFAVKGGLGWVGRKIFSKTNTTLDDQLVDVLRKNARFLLMVMAFHLALREIRKAEASDEESIQQILGYLDALLFVMLVIVMVKIVLGVVRVLLNWYLDELQQGGSGQLKQTLAPLASKIVSILVGMVALVIVLDHFGVNIGSLLVSLGVGSLAVALAAQDTLANMIAGFVILADRPFSVGDRIELPSGQVGDVMEIGLRSTRLANFDNNMIVVPNAELVKGRLINFGIPNRSMRAMVKVNVAYGTDPKRVRSILLEAAAAHPDILNEPVPEVHFTAMLDSAIEFTLIARASQYTARFAAENAIREQVYERLIREGIEIPFPQRVVRMKDA